MGFNIYVYMDISDLINSSPNSIISVLGSGPSLSDNLSKVLNSSDKVIACNGSINIVDSNKISLDYFLCADLFSSTRDWYKKIDEFNINPNFKKLLPNHLIPFDKSISNVHQDLLLLDLREKVSLQCASELVEGLNIFIDNFLDFQSSNYDLERELELRTEYKLYRNLFANYELPKDLDLNVYSFKLKQRIGIPKFNSFDGNFYPGSSITDIGIQIATLLGASEINLSGCDFQNDLGNDYCYDKKLNLD